MLRLSKITDYGIVLLAHMASCEGHVPDEPGCARHSARELSEDVALPLPVVSKILKSLARGGIIESHRGAKGGYSLRADHQEITVANMIAVLEGPVAMTECSASSGSCLLEHSCSVRDPWQIINRVVNDALSEITLKDLAPVDPAMPRPLDRYFGGSHPPGPRKSAGATSFAGALAVKTGRR
jgi:FeS assembly SUF system regulator